MHIEVDSHVIHLEYTAKKIAPSCIPSKEQVADVFMKTQTFISFATSCLNSRFFIHHEFEGNVEIHV